MYTTHYISSPTYNIATKPPIAKARERERESESSCQLYGSKVVTAGTQTMQELNDLVKLNKQPECSYTYLARGGVLFQVDRFHVPRLVRTVALGVRIALSASALELQPHRGHVARLGVHHAPPAVHLRTAEPQERAGGPLVGRVLHRPAAALLGSPLPTAAEHPDWRSLHAVCV